MSTTEEYAKQKELNKQAILQNGFEYGADLVPENIERDPRVVKVNLPDPDEEGNWATGNGEGVWAYIKNPEDMEKYNTGVGTFEVVLLNHSLYYMGLLRWGTVITVEGRGKNRPVLHRPWFTEKMKDTE